MPIQENTELARIAFEEFDACKDNLAKLRAWLISYCAPEFVFHHAGGTDYVGEQMIRMACESVAAFPDQHSVISDTVAEDDRVVIFYTSRGSQKGPYLGVPPTGNQFETKGVQVYRISGTRITDQWNFQDDLGGLIQLGILSVVPYDESRDSRLIGARPFGVLVYTPLTMVLEGVSDLNERRRTVVRHLPVALLCACQNEQCLKDVKAAGRGFPEILPLIFRGATELREDKRLGDWRKYESPDYAAFIASIVNPKL